jgi:multicomponent Na+:H+ antiporter subunit E
MLLLNLLLALAWMALTGQFNPSNFIAGFALGYLLLRLAHPQGKPLAYFQKAMLVLRFAGFYLWELVLANLRVARAVLAVRPKLVPAVIAIPLEARSDLAITLLANLITLTPGSLALDISTDRAVMYVHTMQAEDIDQVRLDIKELEARVLEVTR